MSRGNLHPSPHFHKIRPYSLAYNLLLLFPTSLCQPREENQANTPTITTVSRKPQHGPAAPKNQQVQRGMDHGYDDLCSSEGRCSLEDRLVPTRS